MDASVEKSLVKADAAIDKAVVRVENNLENRE